VGGLTLANPTGQWQVLAVSATPVRSTGTTSEVTLGAFTLPANAMRENGVCRITADFSYPNNANGKTLRVRFGGQLVHSTAQTATGSLAGIWTVFNRGAQQSQITSSNGMTGIGTSAGNAAPLTVDTTQPVAIAFSGQLANAADWIELESWLIEVTNPLAAH
jgi:hypothetical protein